MGCGRLNLIIVYLLLEFDVDVHVIDYYGRNAIHIALTSSTRWDKSEQKILEEKLSLLIEARVDIRHRDQAGRTPSRHAKRFGN